jgi:NRPS condensation-like uncharacterized protein
MTTRPQFFPASIVDETAYFMERAGNTTVTNGWILTLEGKVDSDLVREALLATFDCYPKYKCILTKDYPSFKRWFRYCWHYRDTISRDDVFQEMVASPADTGKDGVTWFRELYDFNIIDVTRHIPLQIILIRKPEEVILLLFHNHILSDGRGLLGVIRRFIQHYEEMYYGREQAESIPDFNAIALPVIRPPWKECSRRHLNIFLKKNRLLFREPAVEVHHHGGKDPAGGFMLVARVLSPDQLGLLKSIAKKRQATINDYMIVAMFKTMKTWNAERGGRSGRFYINVPVSLRAPDDFTASNILGGIFISPDPEALDNEGKLLDQVRTERTFLNENDAAKIDLALTWFFKFIPLKLQELLFNHHSRSLYPSLCLSNIGVCDYNTAHRDEEGFQYMGPARIIGSNVVTAAIPWPQILIHTYNNRMEVSLSVLRSHFSLETAQEFLEAYIRELLGEAS